MIFHGLAAIKKSKMIRLFHPHRSLGNSQKNILGQFFILAEIGVYANRKNFKNPGSPDISVGNSF